MSNPRKAKPKVDLGPDYVLRFASGLFYAGMSAWSKAPYPCSSVRSNEAKKLRGPGLASAERALKRRGYVVERVRVE